MAPYKKQVHWWFYVHELFLLFWALMGISVPKSRIRIQSGQLIQIWIRVRIWTRIQIQEGKKDDQKEKIFLEISCFEVLDVLF
jgi:hypothetical protein